MPKPKTIEGKTKADMRKLGVYKPEFDAIIRIYAEIREQYDILTEKFIISNYDYSESTAQGPKKDPIVTTLETLRKDILSYASQLGLNYPGIKKKRLPFRIAPF